MIYVGEIEGHPAFAFFAETEADAFAWLRPHEECLKADLEWLTDGGDGEIHIREAVDDERRRWDTARARAILDGDQDAADDPDLFVWLIPVSYPTDDEDA